MPSAFWAPRAEQDLEEILFYLRVTDGHPLTAERIGREIFDTAEKQARLPEAGSRHVAAPAEWRYVRHERWLIFYQPHPTGIEIIRLIDAVRELPRALADPME
jgi:plasmid stabilization system protein ParE